MSGSTKRGWSFTADGDSSAHEARNLALLSLVVFALMVLVLEIIGYGSSTSGEAPETLGDQSVLQLLGILLGGALAVDALLIPSLIDISGKAHYLEGRLIEAADLIKRCEKSMMRCTVLVFLSFVVALACSVLSEGSATIDMVIQLEARGIPLRIAYAAGKATLLSLSIVALGNMVRTMFFLSGSQRDLSLVGAMKDSERITANNHRERL